MAVGFWGDVFTQVVAGVLNAGVIGVITVAIRAASPAVFPPSTKVEPHIHPAGPMEGIQAVG